jgi:hypothetical protein
MLLFGCVNRPTHLPPKNKTEDVRHMKDWEEMMEKSRVAGTFFSFI